MWLQMVAMAFQMAYGPNSQIEIKKVARDTDYVRRLARYNDQRYGLWAFAFASLHRDGDAEGGRGAHIQGLRVLRVAHFFEGMGPGFSQTFRMEHNGEVRCFCPIRHGHSLHLPRLSNKVC